MERLEVRAMRIYPVRVEAYQSAGQRVVQQDAFSHSDAAEYARRGLLAVLSDGIGGMENGERYAALAASGMLEAFLASPPTQTDQLPDALAAYYAHAREKALADCGGDGGDGGATVVSVLLRENQFAFLSVGDSRIYLFRGGGLIPLTRDQCMGACLDESAALGYIPSEEARQNLRRKALTNHLCFASEKPCDRSANAIALRPGDKIALLSDGVFGTLKEREMTQILRSRKGLEAHALIDAVLERKKARQDNCSALVVCADAAPSGRVRGDGV